MRRLATFITIALTAIGVAATQVAHAGCDARRVAILLRADVGNRTSWESVRKVDLGQIKGRKLIPDQQDGRLGFGYLRLEEGTLNGKRVFIKISDATVDGGSTGDRTLGRVEIECYWTNYLHEHGKGPGFEGGTIIDGHYAIVTDYAEGVHVAVPLQGEEGDIELPANFHAEPSLLREVSELEEFLNAHDIHPSNLQLRLTPSHLTVIDPEMFRFVVPDPRRDAARVDLANLRRALRRTQ